MSEMDEHPGAVMARIEGKIDLLNERHSNASKAIDQVGSRVQSHSDRINTLEIESHRKAGEKDGFDKAIKGIYALSAAAGVGSIAALAALAKVFVTGH